jgi:hypothetical protein
VTKRATGPKLVHRQAGDRGFERLHDKIATILGEKTAA